VNELHEHSSELLRCALFLLYTDYSLEVTASTMSPEGRDSTFFLNARTKPEDHNAHSPNTEYTAAIFSAHGVITMFLQNAGIQPKHYTTQKRKNPEDRNHYLRKTCSIKKPCLSNHVVNLWQQQMNSR
jgi:hypothetical protein